MKLRLWRAGCEIQKRKTRKEIPKLFLLLSLSLVTHTMDRQKQIANALETYFSDANLLWDKVMQQHLDESRDGCKVI